ncbi:MAG: diaminopropionate ammonia-lyase [Acidobacteria bacterium]|nr:diaminopropionate ammonia-lyase [Acidobacteriota bacterium]
MLTLYHAASRRTGATGLFTAEEYARRRAFFTTRVAPTPLVWLPALAARLGLGDLWIKDETARFGLPAFKSLGVEFAVDALGARGALAGVTTLVCASAGNHGRAVARAARVAGLRARIFLDADVAPARVHAIASEGAEVVRVEGTYDDAVRLAAADAAATGSLVVSDTSWDGYEQVPRDIMLGYTQVMDEAAAAWGADGPPDVVIVQAGVGGLLAAVASWMAWTYGDARPRLVAVEPARAACVQASARAGHPVAVEGPLTTIMAGLRCGEVSPLAFSALDGLVDACVAVDDDWCRAAMRQLARPEGADPRLEVGTSGAAGIAAVLALHAASALEPLGLTRSSRVLAIATEGVTEPDLWRDAVG